ncbi:hypothetical protein Bca4012_057691 [Brassica carinata]
METEFNLSSCTERQHSNDRPWPDENTDNESGGARKKVKSDEEGTKNGLSSLQVLMGTISLLRTKEKSSIGLPPKTDGTCYVDLSPEERQLYDHMEEEAKGVVQNLINSGSLMRNYSTVLSIILRLRQLCDDVSLCPPELRSLTTLTSIEEQMACILQTLQRTKPSCPLCRGSLTQSDLFNAPPPPSDSQDNDEGDTKPSTKSSKVTALLSLLIASKQENPNTKSVVFSQFRNMLLLLEVLLRAAGFTVSRLDGGMTEETDASHWRLWETGVNRTCGVACQPNVRNF